MDKKIVAIIGITISFLFVSGFAILFLQNTIAFEEANNVSLAAFNIPIMKGSLTAQTTYITVGVMNVLFCVGYFLVFRKDVINIVGISFLFIAGLLWISFGLVEYQTTTDVFGIFVVRIISMLFVMTFGLVILGFKFFDKSTRHFVNILSLIIGSVCLTIGVLNSFVFDDTTWIRTNALIALYFIWFGIFGLLVLASNGKYSLPRNF